MVEEYVFQPERRTGIIVNLAGMLAFTLAGAYGIYRASLASIGPAFLVFLLPSLAALVVIPMLAYRAYALRTAAYVLEREGLHLRWGLRLEDIPITHILWVRRMVELKTPVPLPRMHWPGAVLGVRRYPGGGEVEYLASDVDRLVLVGTADRVYALSPANPDTFLLAFDRCIEMGSLSPLAGRSVYPSFLLTRVWQSTPARVMVLVGPGLSLLMFIWVSLIISNRPQVMMGVRPGYPGDLVPSVRLLLLPVLNFLFVVIDFFGGLFFYRRPESLSLAYLVWSAGVLTSLAFLAAVFFILRA